MCKVAWEPSSLIEYGNGREHCMDGMNIIDSPDCHSQWLATHSPVRGRVILNLFKDTGNPCLLTALCIDYTSVRLQRGIMTIAAFCGHMNSIHMLCNQLAISRLNKEGGSKIISHNYIFLLSNHSILLKQRRTKVMSSLKSHAFFLLNTKLPVPVMVAKQGLPVN